MPTDPSLGTSTFRPAQSDSPASATQGDSRPIPSLADLRSALMGTRFEFLKIGAFAAFLFSFVAIAVHGSHLANPDNQFAANTWAAVSGLAGAVSNKFGALTASGRGEAQALACATFTHAPSSQPAVTANSTPVRLAQGQLLSNLVRSHHSGALSNPRKWRWPRSGRLGAITDAIRKRKR